MFLNLTKYVMYLIVFIFAMAIFIPKSNGYYFIENKLAQHGIILNNETINEKVLSMSIRNIDIHLNNEKFGRIEEIYNSFLGFKNYVKVKEFYLLNEKETSKSTLEIFHNVFYPTILKLNLKKSSFKIEGNINLLTRKVFFKNQATLVHFKEIFNRFKFSRSEEGYMYEY